jgi:DMSO/TMAO reductase YedYZ molybdopterin-dependent catalytic subunit
VTPRGTDWSLALLVGAGVTSGLATWFAGSPGASWVFAAHAVAGGGLAAVVVVKLRRVLPSVGLASAVALGFVVLVLGSGFVWASFGSVSLAGFTVLAWHAALGGVLAAVVFAHALGRAKPLRRRDLADRRQFLVAGAVGAAALGAWAVQRPVQRALGLAGARRRFTGSYDVGPDFPVTSWVADDPAPSSHRLALTGLVEHDLSLAPAQLDRGEALVATLDCTGGFSTRQDWHGVRLGTLLDEAGVARGARHVRVISRTGYRWSFGLDDARGLLLATRVAGEPLSHGHGAPCRLVAPGRRGFQWVKWVERIEVHEDPDPGAIASTVLSSFSAAGRGRRTGRR